MKRLGPLLLIAMLLPSVVLGQRSSASISGVVSDPSGAVVVGAHVVVSEISTGASTKVESNAQGFYEATALRPGDYRVHVDAPGFQG